MSNPLHAQHYADEAVVCRAAEIVEQVQLARDTFRTRVTCPALASRILPGQFVMVRLSGCDDPLIGRPLAMYDVWHRAGEPAGVDVVYVVKGKLTTRLAKCVPGQCVDVWGPLGNGFDAVEPGGHDPHLVLVAGGIGQTPFLALGKQRLGRAAYGNAAAFGSAAAIAAAKTAGKVTLCYGARSAERLAGVGDFEAAGFNVRICTDDGSAGRHGLVTEDLDELLAGSVEQEAALPRVVCCGPEPMMKAASLVAAKHGARCEVSLETPMACGIGICFSCVAKVKQDDGQWDYKRTCVDGPVFDAGRIEWD